jgi:hypothetical protein
MFVPELRKAATIWKVGSNPVRVASLLEEGEEVPQREGAPAKVVGKLEFHETFTRSAFGCTP